jgi:tRNA/tmRNA/rRNA uracil-C5-methylase (TrmA/RlmC/RlmD family)
VSVAAGPACPHRPPCGGCPRFGQPGLAPATLATLQALARQHGLPDVPVVSGATSGFRLRARLAIRGRPGSPRIGLFEPGSHRVVHIPHCSIHHPLINRVAAVVRRALVDSGVTTYSESSQRGVARYLQVVVERRSQRAQVVLVANSPTVEPLAACLELIRERLGDELHSLWFNRQCEPTNVILGPHFDHWCGPASVVEHFGGAAVHYPPGAFGQNNLDIAERIVDQLREWVRPGASVMEFYAGVGAIGLSLLERVRRIRLNELSPASLEGLALGLAGLAPDQRDRIEVVPGAAGEVAAQRTMTAVDTVIADPPRKGLDHALARQLIATPPAQFIYVSCGLAALATDIERLTATGALRLRELRAYNLVPYTDHVETLARFERADQPRA